MNSHGLLRNLPSAVAPSIPVTDFQRLDPVMNLFWTAVVERGWYHHYLSDTQIVDRGALDPEALKQAANPFGSTQTVEEFRFVAHHDTNGAVLCLPWGLVAFRWPDEPGEDRIRINWSIASDDPGKSSDCSERIKATLPPVTPVRDDQVNMAFWAHNRSGPPARVDRYITAPTWHEIICNYPISTYGSVKALMSLRPPVVGGQFILLHGEPGTGKTYAIRALAREWSAWASFHYVVDPEMLFSDSAYLLSVVLSDHEPDRWKVLVAEDSDEFITIDAKQRSGQGMARLLNLTEGMLGQGLKVLVVLTTNEELGKLHPAVVRPGRCLSKVQFVQFSRDEVRRWLSDHGRSDIMIPSSTTLADLYRMLTLP